ncbi:MAG TPA: aminotransferase class IV [Bacillota bacterium]|jgi:branched-chain amino acid aminotransferase|nr:aminotransferase class IV [Bacillota bacterium]
MDDNTGRYYIEDGVIKESSQAQDADTHSGVMIYDVIRIIEGTPLFFEDHYTRTCKSFEAIGSVCGIKANELKDQIRRILEANDNYNCNIKYIMFNENGRARAIGYICKSHYPTEGEIKSGMPVGLFSLERENPNIKLVDHDYKKKINKIKSEKGFYEVFLVDREGNVTEGGTSNIFFIKKDKIFTAPEEKVLKGITRTHVIMTCKALGYDVIETSIPADRIDEAEAVFLSGTSPKVLPVSSIDNIRFDSANHPVIAAIRKAFDKRIQEYLEQS